MNNLDESELKVAALVGVSESYITKKASGQRTRKVMSQWLWSVMLNHISHSFYKVKLQGM